jgi:hypothetical protein
MSIHTIVVTIASLELTCHTSATNNSLVHTLIFYVMQIFVELVAVPARLIVVVFIIFHWIIRV